MSTGINCYVNESIQFANEHPRINDLDMRANVIEADNAVTVFRQLNSLEHFGFIVKNRIEHDRLLNQLDVKWQYNVLSIGDGGYAANDDAFFLHQIESII